MFNKAFQFRIPTRATAVPHSGRPWETKGEMLTLVERKSREIIDTAGLQKELTFTPFGRHGGATESAASGLTELELMKKGQWSSTKSDGELRAQR